MPSIMKNTISSSAIVISPCAGSRRNRHPISTAKMTEISCSQKCGTWRAPIRLIRLAAKQRPCAGPQHNPAAVLGTKIEKLDRTTHGGGLCGFLASQPPELVLNGGGCRAKFGGDAAVHEALRPQDQQPLDREWGPGKT